MKLFRVLVVVFICLCLVSCSEGETAAVDILGDMTRELSGLPQGVVYTPDAEEGEEGYLSGALAEALYGEGTAECFALVEDYAIYLSSFASPYEIAVFKCYSRSDALRIEQMCRARADIVSVALRETEFYSLSGNIRIVRKGDTVVFCMTDEPDRSERLARRSI